MTCYRMLLANVRKIRAQRICDYRMASRDLTPDEIFNLTLDLTGDMEQAGTAKAQALLDLTRKGPKT
jgi:hypothetical protein